MQVQWFRFDYANKAATAPKAGGYVWIMEDFYEQGVTLGYFDGATMRTAGGSDDCHVTHWAAIEYPQPPRTEGES